MAVTPTEGYKRLHFRGISRRNRDDKKEGQEDHQEHHARQVAYRENEGPREGILPRRGEGVPGPGELQKDDGEAHDKDRVETARAGGVAGDNELQNVRKQQGDGRRVGTARGEIGGSGRRGTWSKGDGSAGYEGGHITTNMVWLK